MKTCAIIAAVILLICALGCAYGYENNNDDIFSGFLYGFFAVPVPFVLWRFASLPKGTKLVAACGIAFVLGVGLKILVSDSSNARMSREQQLITERLATEKGDREKQRVLQDQADRVGNEREAKQAQDAVPNRQALTEDEKDAQIMESYDAIFREVLGKRLAAETNLCQNQPIRLDAIKRFTQIVEACRAKTDSFLGTMVFSCVGDYLAKEQLDANGNEIKDDRADEAGRLSEIIGEVNAETKRRNKVAVAAAGRLNANGEVIFSEGNDPAEVARGAANMRARRAKLGLPPLKD